LRVHFHPNPAGILTPSERLVELDHAGELRCVVLPSFPDVMAIFVAYLRFGGLAWRHRVAEPDRSAI
jgi:hypothetical protein